MLAIRLTTERGSIRNIRIMEKHSNTLLLIFPKTIQSSYCMGKPGEFYRAGALDSLGYIFTDEGFYILLFYIFILL